MSFLQIQRAAHGKSGNFRFPALFWKRPQTAGSLAVQLPVASGKMSFSEKKYHGSIINHDQTLNSHYCAEILIHREEEDAAPEVLVPKLTESRVAPGVTLFSRGKNK